jgi:7,8-dihydropterin-6-yl-methyl-4-(beta-D-ribofuranosyl)aminobenzene 5'-phosphate synthase
MKVTVLVENSALEGREDVRAEFGLSLHVEHQGHRILFDTGTSGVFADNAKAMGIALEEVEAAVLSHHHFDHGGGLARFFEANERAPLYLREREGRQPQVRAFGFIKRSADLDWGSLEKYNSRLRFVKGPTEITPGIFLLTEIGDDHERPRGNRWLFIEKDGAVTHDPFDHELLMVVREDDGMAVFTGCSHRGVLNMIDAAVAHFPDVPIKAVFGGFHLMGLPFFNSMAGSRGEVEDIARQISARVEGPVYTGHCTGAKAFGVLRGVMGETLQSMPTGANIEI